MSYVRWCKESDVYVYPSEDGYVCCGCSLSENDGAVFSNVKDMIMHLVKHVKEGSKVPDYVFIGLLCELPDEDNNAND